jgi:hypothetical protein
MKKIKLKFKNEWDAYAFYDLCWCRGYDYPQCATCERNRSRYKNWDPDRCYTSFAFTPETLTQAEQGNCHMYVRIEKDRYNGED